MPLAGRLNAHQALHFCACWHENAPVQDRVLVVGHTGEYGNEGFTRLLDADVRRKRRC
jgi:hypothetical protein